MFLAVCGWFSTIWTLCLLVGLFNPNVLFVATALPYPFGHSIHAKCIRSDFKIIFVISFGSTYSGMIRFRVFMSPIVQCCHFQGLWLFWVQSIDSFALVAAFHFVHAHIELIKKHTKVLNKHHRWNFTRIARCCQEMYKKTPYQMAKSIYEMYTQFRTKNMTLNDILFLNFVESAFLLCSFSHAYILHSFMSVLNVWTMEKWMEKRRQPRFSQFGDDTNWLWTFEFQFSAKFHCTHAERRNKNQLPEVLLG